MPNDELSKLEQAITAGFRRVALGAAKEAFDERLHGPTINSPNDIFGKSADYLPILETHLGARAVRWSDPLEQVLRQYLFRQGTLHIRLTQLISAFWLDWIDPGPEQISELTRRDLLTRLQANRRSTGLSVTPTLRELEDLEDIVSILVSAARATAEELRGKYRVTPAMNELLTKAQPNPLTTAMYTGDPLPPPVGTVRAVLQAARVYVCETDSYYTMNFFSDSEGGPIESLHVMPALLHVAESGTPGEGSYGELSLETLLRGDERHWVILGDPGAGKSSLCKRISYDVASSPDFVGIVPVRIKARKLSGIHTIAEFEDYLFDTLRPHIASRMPGANDQFMRLVHTMLLEHGHTILIVDALDEVVEIGDRRALCKVLETFRVHRPETRVVASSRRQGYGQARLEGYRESRLLPLDRNRIHAIATVTCQARRTEHRLPGLLAAIDDHYTDLGDLLSNPLLLCLISSLYHVHRSLPSSRAEIFEGSTELLTSGWDEHRDIESTGVDTTIHDALGAVAAEIIKLEAEGESGIGRDRLITTLTSHFRGNKVRDGDRARDLAMSLTRNLAGRSWMLVATSHGEDSLGFQHRTFLEYYYAYSLLERSDRRLVPELHELLHDRIRWATTVDLIMLLLRRARRLDGLLELVIGDPDAPEIALDSPEARNLALAIIYSCRSHPIAYSHVDFAIKSLLLSLDIDRHASLARQSDHRSISDLLELGTLLGSVCSDAIDTVFESLLGSIASLSDPADELLLFSSAYLRVREREDLLQSRADWLTLLRNLVRRSGWRIGHEDRRNLDVAGLLIAYAGGVVGSVGLLSSDIGLLEPIRVGYRIITPAALFLDLMDDDYLGSARDGYRYHLPALLVEAIPRLRWPVEVAAASIEGIEAREEETSVWPARSAFEVEQLPSEFLVFAVLISDLATEVDGLVASGLGDAIDSRFARVRLPTPLSPAALAVLEARESPWLDYYERQRGNLLSDDVRNQTSG